MCDRNSNNSPYRMEAAYTSTPTANGQIVCFKVAALNKCDRTKKCCDVSLSSRPPAGMLMPKRPHNTRRLSPHAHVCP